MENNISSAAVNGTAMEVNVTDKTPSFIVPQNSVELWTAIGVIAVITNSVLFLSLILSRSLRNQSHVIISSSFVIGILFGGIYILPRWAAFDYFRQFGLICSIMPLLGSAFLLNYNLHQCFTSLDRYFAVKWPIKYRRKVHKRLYLYIVVILWVFSFATAFIPAMTFRPLSSSHCVVHSGNFLAERIFAYWKFLGWFFVPVTVIVFCYSQTFYMIYSKRKKSVAPSISCNYRLGKTTSKKTINASIQMGILAAIFIVMMLPYTCGFIISEFGRILPISVQFILNMQFITRYIAFSYPAINPLLYAYFVDTIRHAFLNLFRLQKSKSSIIPKISQVASG
ncbi:uncharacterized protein TRIADDRAFT_59534 [Trichoplax adhaerens]|uniref:G-protein coupled receptors family 1 profile domain-containing protein n=1 Tax=Trichoplax adhaerens TaxID=10228 RepID=B3S5W8_TRIAD|nr:hypothetical protein TRIADDRAFT_59534 [Trichoplax adhaerens]EDV21880.1 hypothetical protein TRIADDRAFT_59534 [Trichoplax adhaerens]|eukprot:XP_002115517.1 hypothetical protein TRIADDRAFT_59534 [Trichoplax adhaerens]